MKPIRNAVEVIFASPIQNMTFVNYLSYVNEAGKVTARSLLELSMVALTYLEEQEKKIAQYESNFTEIESILSKLVDKKVQDTQVPVAPPTPPPAVTMPVEPLTCDVCGRVVKSKLGLLGHKRIHTAKQVV